MTKPPMKWKNLTQYKCPKCGEDLLPDSRRGNVCTRCAFAISADKLESFIGRSRNQKRAGDGRLNRYQQEEDTQELLNNL